MTTFAGDALAVASCDAARPVEHTYSACICFRNHCAHIIGNSVKSNLSSFLHRCYLDHGCCYRPSPGSIGACTCDSFLLMSRLGYQQRTS